MWEDVPCHIIVKLNHGRARMMEGGVEVDRAASPAKARRFLGGYISTCVSVSGPVAEVMKQSSRKPVHRQPRCRTY